MTIRFLVILAICIAIAFLPLPGSTSVVLTKTGRELDLAIVGRGSFRVVDSEAADCCYTRNGGLIIGLNGQLAVESDGKQWILDPPITIPSDWERISVRSDGEVEALGSGGWATVGTLQLALFTSEPAFDEPLGINPTSDRAEFPILHTPGEVAGNVQQGWVEQSDSSLNGLAVRILLAILSAGVLARCAAPRDVVGSSTQREFQNGG